MDKIHKIIYDHKYDNSDIILPKLEIQYLNYIIEEIWIRYCNSKLKYCKHHGFCYNKIQLESSKLMALQDFMKSKLLCQYIYFRLFMTHIPAHTYVNNIGYNFVGKTLVINYDICDDDIRKNVVYEMIKFLDNDRPSRTLKLYITPMIPRYKSANFIE